jgi:hypothetical protein
MRRAFFGKLITELSSSGVASQLRELTHKLDLVLRHTGMLMATREEVQTDLKEIRTIVTETRGVANSALALLKEALDRVGVAAASATDLDAFRADLKIIRDETVAMEGELKAAVTANPAP